jgi:hypothetical protein
LSKNTRKRMKLSQLIIVGRSVLRSSHFNPAFYNNQQYRFYSFASAIVSPEDAQAMKTICTHDGNFHADEALACYMLTQLPVYKGAKIVR